MESDNNIRAKISASNANIREAIARGDMDRAQTIVSRKVGWRVLAGDISVKLKPTSP